MIGTIAKKIFGTKNARELKKMQPLVAQINELEPTMKGKSDAELAAMTPAFREQLDNGATLEDLLPEAFAVVREAGRRVLNMRHFDVQLMGGMALHKGKIAEMKTGEGKTLVATLPLYLNALARKGTHLVTVNDYLARRDAEWMGRIYKFLGMTTGIVVHGLTDRERQVSYRSDIAYGTNSEFGFDYLRDNMKESIERYVQRDLNYAIVDEVDSILIDEARTPLIISGPAEESADLYYKVNAIIPSLKKDVDYTVDEKAHSVMTTDQGIERLEKLLNVGNLYDPQNIEMLHHVTQALRAHTLYKRDVNYLVEDGKVLIIDEFTGRKMPGRRWSDGLHQAVEAKEGVTVEEENQTLATISYQNYFRMYKKLGGMTGTADTEAAEFHSIYKLDVTVIPTNKDMIRIDNPDLVYKNERGKFRAVIKEIEELHGKGQPILVGTISVEKSEVLSSMLKKRGIKHYVLNAKNHAKEAEIVAQAGRYGALTISTNMAGRGTDIILGGNPEFLAKAEFDPEAQPQEYAQALAKYREQCAAEREQVLKAGGLHILGTERHESRRIDNQLRGRSGRQGDPGSSRFYMSLEDDLLRIFGAERITGLMERLGMEEDVPIEHSLVNRAIENAQKRVEGHNFDIRKNLLEYDDVMNQQRKSIYALRRQILEGRYQPELGEEDKKRGKTPLPPPIMSGKWTIESLAETIKEGVARVVDAFNEATLPKSVAGDGGASTTAPAAEVPRDPQILAHELYRYYGALVDVAKLIDDRDACVAEAARQCGASLIQQRERILDLADELLQRLIGLYCSKQHAEDWNLKELREAIREMFNYDPDLKPESMDHESLAQHLWQQLERLIESRESDLGPLRFYYFARYFFLEEIDAQWIDHLKSMDHLREGIGLRGYGQKDPKQEYKKEGFDMFVAMMERITQNVSGKLFRMQLVKEEALPEVKHKRPRKTVESGGDMPQPTVGGGTAQMRGGATAQLANAAQASAQGPIEKVKTIRREEPKVGRNDPCPCGSGKKYKKCHGGAQATP